VRAGADAFPARGADWLSAQLHDDSLDVENKLRNLSGYDGSALARERVFSQGLAELRRSAAAAAIKQSM